MGMVTENGFGEALVHGRVDNRHYLQRQGLEYVGSTPLPIGFVFLSVVSTNPADLLGYGTWVSLGAGRVLVGVDPTDTDFDTVRKLSGAKTHALTVSELPSHSHGLTQIRGGGTGSQTTIASGLSPGTDTTSTPIAVATDTTGSGAAHSNLQPGFVVYMWERTA